VDVVATTETVVVEEIVEAVDAVAMTEADVVAMTETIEAAVDAVVMIDDDDKN
jgi:hypothetical protein